MGRHKNTKKIIGKNNNFFQQKVYFVKLKKNIDKNNQNEKSTFSNKKRDFVSPKSQYILPPQRKTCKIKQ